MDPWTLKWTLYFMYVTECTDRQMFQFVDWAKKTEVKLFFPFSEEIWTESAFPPKCKGSVEMDQGCASLVSFTYLT